MNNFDDDKPDTNATEKFEITDDDKARYALIEAEAAALLRAINAEGAAKNAAKIMNGRARKIRRSLMLPEKLPGDMEQSLFDQARMLDVLFRQLMLDSCESESINERDGIALALRTQSQYRISLQALDNIAKRSGRARRK